RAWAIEMAQLAQDRNCTNIVILEVAQRSPVAKHFVIATGTSNQQIRALGNEIEKLGKDRKNVIFGRAGLQQGRWAVIDFVDVIIHLFDEEFRDFYNLEMLWGDAPKVDFSRDEPKPHPSDA
ncbi:MAG: ribosome silencing factor, partial [Phycisphaerae bacterium]|nr:ribosome silencing factor [Phycisphaerae bacterium]